MGAPAAIAAIRGRFGRWRRKWLCDLLRCAVARRRYARLERAVREASSARPVRILFPVGSLAKWKLQPLFDRLRADPRFEPVAAATVMDVENRLDEAGRRALVAGLLAEFRGRGADCVAAYDVARGGWIPLAEFRPDVVFYQQPWDIAPCQAPWRVSRHALTCYVPYYVPNHDAPEMDCDLPFHRLLWRHFTLSGEFASWCEAHQGRWCRAGRAVGTGHPMLDLVRASVPAGPPPADGCVVYAPHWSCGAGERYSTFHRNGRRMLEFAQAHPEVRWAFRPHPTLRTKLVELGIMSAAEVDGYYAAWGRLGEVSEGGDYMELFRRSRAMVTDCASFLVEYGVTLRPLIRLVSGEARYAPHPALAGLIGAHYAVRDWGEFARVFREVVLEGRDPGLDRRRAAVAGLGFARVDAAANIVASLSADLLPSAP